MTGIEAKGGFTLDWGESGTSVFREQGTSSWHGSWREACCWFPAVVVPGMDDRVNTHPEATLSLSQCCHLLTPCAS